LKFSAKINIGEVKGVPVPKTHVRYSDNHGVFRVNHEGALGGDGMTQFGRALDALNIEIICANSSQAKGRVERAHKTPACPGWPRETNRAMAQHTAEENAVSSAPSCDPHQHG